jgi:hypothetical protein
MHTKWENVSENRIRKNRYLYKQILFLSKIPHAIIALSAPRLQHARALARSLQLQRRRQAHMPGSPCMRALWWVITLCLTIPVTAGLIKAGSFLREIFHFSVTRPVYLFAFSCQLTRLLRSVTRLRSLAVPYSSSNVFPIHHTVLFHSYNVVFTFLLIKYLQLWERTSLANTIRIYSIYARHATIYARHTVCTSMEPQS